MKSPGVLQVSAHPNMALNLSEVPVTPYWNDEMYKTGKRIIVHCCLSVKHGHGINTPNVKHTENGH